MDEAELPEEQGEGPDLWAGALPGQVMVPAYLVSRYAAQYRVIVDVLLAAMDTNLTGMSYDKVAHAVTERVRALAGTDTAERLLEGSNFALEARLGRLVAWKVVTRWQEPARTGEDFLRRRDRYQLTPLAARLHAFWAETDDADDEAADLTLAPRAIHDRLKAFTEAMAEERYPAAASEFQQVIALHHAMARAARSWQRTLAHNLSGTPDEAKQEQVGRTLRAYIAMWGEQVDVYSPRIADMVTRTPSSGAWRACARGALAEHPDEEMVQAQAERWEQTWHALQTWFCGPQAQARRLRRQLRDVISPWARNTHFLMEAGGVVTRRAELLELAAVIERAPDETTAWRLWDTALGVFSARHLLVPAESLEDDTETWESAPPAPVPAKFREQGHRAMVGRRPRRADYAAGRDAARRERAKLAAARAAAEAALRRRSGTRLSQWPRLDGAELDLLLELIAAARRSGPGHEAITQDGRWRVRLGDPADPADVATLIGPDGRLVTVDWMFELQPAS
ncbi:TIGR02677 family protein [Thermomonospora echinospora]|uniref:TIGR02677 family protein n=1 Tax=Thermomonospora echinospora TaxID=1992 RepID=A0A1H6AXE6_9ACTN|nr:DUF2397 domain-containing protein [Thermomonospora echinospora]SEG52940.1 TIGR02677 family protein [Thermomonospora echinospora]